MASFTKEISFRWSDLDPNFHVRHSAYYDFGAQHRIEILEELGLTLRVMQTQGFGPVLFRDECVFRKELKLSAPAILQRLSKQAAAASARLLASPLARLPAALPIRSARSANKPLTSTCNRYQMLFGLFLVEQHFSLFAHFTNQQIML